MYIRYQLSCYILAVSGVAKGGPKVGCVIPMKMEIYSNRIVKYSIKTVSWPRLCPTSLASLYGYATEVANSDSVPVCVNWNLNFVV